MVLTLFFTFTWSWHWPNPNIITKGLPFALASNHAVYRDALTHHLLCRQTFCTKVCMQATALLYFGKSPYEQNNSLSN